MEGWPVSGVELGTGPGKGGQDGMNSSASRRRGKFARAVEGGDAWVIPSAGLGDCAYPPGELVVDGGGGAGRDAWLQRCFEGSILS
jgi:hypothetical protein